LLTEDEEKLLKAELITYALWLLKQDLLRLWSVSTIFRYSRAIKQKVGVNILSNRRPERLLALDLSEILTVENIVPVPGWLIEAGRYWAPGRYERLAREPESIEARGQCHRAARGCRFCHARLCSISPPHAMALHCLNGAEMMRLTRWENSIGLRLPCEVAHAAGLKPVDYVYVRLLDPRGIRVRPAKNVQPAHPATAADGKMRMAQATLPAAVVTTW